VYTHTDSIILNNVRFNVAKAGQRKVRETGRKNVHARVSGYALHYTLAMAKDFRNEFGEAINSPDDSGIFGKGWRMATYNPYKNDTFVDAVTGAELHDASRVLMFTREGEGPVILYRPTLSG
jgi:hypothetical protein